jgi:hypothetical protein
MEKNRSIKRQRQRQRNKKRMMDILKGIEC